MSRARRRSILVHHCFNPFLRDKSTNKLSRDAQPICSCTRRITLPDALAYVHDELALFCSTRGSGPILLSDRPEGYSELVMMGKGARHKAHTITKSDIERAYCEGQSKAIQHIEAYGESMRGTWEKLTTYWDGVRAQVAAA